MPEFCSKSFIDQMRSQLEYSSCPQPFQVTALYSVVLSVTGSSEAQPLPFLLLLLRGGPGRDGSDVTREGSLEKGGMERARPRVGRWGPEGWAHKGWGVQIKTEAVCASLLI